MSTRLCLLLASVALLAGCGGGSSHSTGSAPGSTAQTGPTEHANVQQAVAACEGAVASSPYVPQADKSTARSACEEIKGGNVSGLRKIAHQACEKAVAAVPAAEQAVVAAECKKLG